MVFEQKAELNLVEKTRAALEINVQHFLIAINNYLSIKIIILFIDTLFFFYVCDVFNTFK